MLQQDIPALDGHRPTRRPASRRLRTRVTAVAVLVGVLGVGACSGSSDKSATKSPKDSSVTEDTGATTTAPKKAGKVLKWTVPVVGVPVAYKDDTGGPMIEPQEGATPKPGIYYFESYDGWHIRIVRGDGINDVHGLVTGQPGKNGGATVGEVNGADPSIAKANGADFEFTLPAGEGDVAIDFNLNANTRLSQVTFNSAAGPIDVTKIYLGRDATSPLTNPITITKQ